MNRKQYRRLAVTFLSIFLAFLFWVQIAGAQTRSKTSMVVPKQEAEKKIKSFIQTIDKAKAETNRVYGYGVGSKNTENALRQAGVTNVLANAGPWGEWMWVFWQYMEEGFYDHHRLILNSAWGKPVTHEQMAVFDNGMQRFPQVHKQALDIMRRYLNANVQRGLVLDEFDKESKYYWTINNRTQQDEARQSAASPRRDDGEKKVSSIFRGLTAEQKIIVQTRLFEYTPTAVLSKKEYTITSVDVTDSLYRDRLRDIERQLQDANRELTKKQKEIDDLKHAADRLTETLSRLMKEEEDLEKQILSGLEELEKASNPKPPKQYKNFVDRKEYLQMRIPQILDEMNSTSSGDAARIRQLAQDRDQYMQELESINDKLKKATPAVNTQKTASLKARINRLTSQANEKKAQIYRIENGTVISVGADSGELKSVFSRADTSRKEKQEIEWKIRDLELAKLQARQAPTYIASVVVTADGSVVAKASREDEDTYRAKQDRLRKDLEIARVRQSEYGRMMKQNEETKLAAFKEFKDNNSQAQAALDRVYSLRWWTFGKEMAIESTSFLADAALATAQKGYPGALFECIKKGCEIAAFHGQNIPGVDEKSIEAEVNKELNAGLKDAWSGPQLEKTALMRLTKESFVMDRGTKLVYKSLEQELGDEILKPPDWILTNKLRDALAYLKKPFGAGPSADTIMKLGIGVAKDAAKSALLHYAQKPEIEAWTEFYLTQKLAGNFYAVYGAAAEEFHASNEKKEMADAEVKRLEAALSVDTRKFSISSAKPFTQGQTIVTTLGFDVMSMPLIMPPGKQERQEIIIGSVKAQAAGKNSHSLVAKDLVETRKGEVGLVINQGN
ncbi:MAG: hypothetical protein ABFD12_07195 [Syntrophorhabdus sp.]